MTMNRLNRLSGKIVISLLVLCAAAGAASADTQTVEIATPAMTSATTSISNAPTVKTAPTATAEALPMPGSTRALGLSLFKALASSATPDVVEPLLKSALEHGGKACRQTSAWQIYRLSALSRTLKIKCPSVNLYALTVAKTGEMQYSGGDGSLAPMASSDGRIMSAFGQRADEYLHNSKNDPLQVVDQGAHKTVLANGEPTANVSVNDTDLGIGTTPVAEVPLAPPAAAAKAIAAAPPPLPSATADGVAPRGVLSPWLVSAVIFNAVLLGGIGWLVARHLRSARISPTGHFGADPQWGLSSDDKDHMLDESHELYPNIYSHPRGFFIARGKRGKRRLFRFAFAAMLYRDFGLKIAEIESE